MEFSCDWKLNFAGRSTWLGNEDASGQSVWWIWSEDFQKISGRAGLFFASGVESEKNAQCSRGEQRSEEFFGSKRDGERRFLVLCRVWLSKKKNEWWLAVVVRKHRISHTFVRIDSILLSSSFDRGRKIPDDSSFFPK